MAAAKDQRVRLSAVAATAGVSVATVSKVLNGRADVSSATRARVQDALAEHRYTDRHVGVASTPVVELLFQADLSAYSAAVIQGAAQAAATFDVTISVAVRLRERHPDTETVAGRWVRSLVTGGRSAVISVASELRPAELAALARAGMPLVVIDPLNRPAAEAASVGSTNFRGGVDAARHLLELGHRRVAFLGGPAAAECNNARLQGFRSTLEADGVMLPTERVHCAPSFSYAAGVTTGDDLLRLGYHPSAVFCASDELAAGLIEAARRRNLRVPQDVSVIGFDDTALASTASPPLTTIRQPIQEMAVVAVRNALRLARKEPIDSPHVELATELVVRHSTIGLPK